MREVRRQAPRRLRGALFATTVAALAVAAHAAGGGGLPDIGTVVIVTVLIATAASAHSGRRTSVAGVGAALVAAQVSMHLILDTASAHHDVTAPVTGGWRMLLAHAVATVVTAIVLAVADDAALAVIAAVRALLPVPVPVFPAEAPLPRPAPGPAVDIVRQVMSRVGRPRRGPPYPR